MAGRFLRLEFDLLDTTNCLQQNIKNTTEQNRKVQYIKVAEAEAQYSHVQGNCGISSPRA